METPPGLLEMTRKECMTLDVSKSYTWLLPDLLKTTHL